MRLICMWKHLGVFFFFLLEKYLNEDSENNAALSIKSGNNVALCIKHGEWGVDTYQYFQIWPRVSASSHWGWHGNSLHHHSREDQLRQPLPQVLLTLDLSSDSCHSPIEMTSPLWCSLSQPQQTDITWHYQWIVMAPAEPWCQSH